MKPSLPAVASALFAWLFAARGFAQATTFEVPAECGDELAFETELVRLAGEDAARARPSLIRIAREGADGLYRLTLVVGGQTRELEHTDCHVLLRSAAIIVAASLEAETPAPPALAPRAAPELRARAITAPELRAPTAIPASHSNESARGADWRGDLAVGVGVTAGVMPGASAAFELRGGVLGELFGASVGVRYFPPRFLAVDGRGVDIWGLGVRAAAVVAPVPALHLSLGLDADRLSGRGSGVATPERASAWTVAPSAELAVIPFQNKHLSLELAAEGRLALVRPVFVVTGFQELYRVPNWGGWLVLRGVWRFP